MLKNLIVLFLLCPSPLMAQDAPESGFEPDQMVAFKSDVAVAPEPMMTNRRPVTS